MLLTQYYLGCLSHASYLIGDTTTGRAVVVDPQRDVAQYLADAEASGLHIERVIETHFHADFVSGHLELATAARESRGAGGPQSQAVLRAGVVRVPPSKSRPQSRSRVCWYCKVAPATPLPSCRCCGNTTPCRTASEIRWARWR